jgi:5'-nucleotidase
MNVNFPKIVSAEVKGIRVARQGRRPGGIEIVPASDPVGRSYLWIGDYISDESLEPDTDLAATRRGYISVTPLHLDLTHQSTLKRLRRAFA